MLSPRLHLASAEDQRKPERTTDQECDLYAVRAFLHKVQGVSKFESYLVGIYLTWDP